MPLTASQLRVIIVIIISCAAVNLVLYTSAVFSVTRTQQENSIVIDSGQDVLINDDTNDRIFLKPRSSHGKPQKSTASTVKNLGRKERKRNSGWTGSNSFVGSSLGGRDGGEEDHHVDRKDEDSRKLRRSLRSSVTAAPVLQVLNETEAKPVSTKRGTSTPVKVSEDFNLDNALRLFQGCIVKEDDISVDCFNDAYQELSKLFKPLGTIFSFVTSEIQEKISILRDYRRHPVQGPHFRTVQSMVRYEMDHKLTTQTDNPSGSRTFLRLHWALQFISALVTKIKDMDDSTKFSEEATEAYDQTLAKHHPWIMRKAVHLATYSLPDWKELLVKLNVRDTPEERGKVQALITHLDAIYDISQKLFADNHLLDLP